MFDNISLQSASHLVKDKKTWYHERQVYMKKKAKLLVIIVSFIGIILMFPICLRLKDGGSKIYRSIVGIYEVKNWKKMGYIEGAGETLKTGITVKVFGIKIFDNTRNAFAGYADSLGAIGTTNFPTTMSADEMLQKAIDEEFVVLYEFQFLHGEEQWKEFYETTQKGTPATIYLAKYYTMDREGVSEEYYEANKGEYPKLFLFCLCFDGENYTITDRPGTMEAAELVRTYPHLVKMEGKPTSATALYDRYEYYVLVHDESLRWSEIERGMFSSRMGDAIDHYSVVMKHIME